KVSPEPKIRWQNFVNLRLDKVVDDQDQTLTQAADAPAGPGGPVPRFGPGGGGFGGGFGGAAFIPNFGTLHQDLPLRVTKGDKESKSLKLLAGNITAQVLAEPEVHITADNILKAKGKTFKGKEGGLIKVLTVEENGQRLTLSLEFEAPANIVPVNQGFNPWGGPGGGPMILPAVPPKLNLPKGAFQIQLQQAQPAVQVAPVQVKVQQAQPAVQAAPVQIKVQQ